MTLVFKQSVETNKEALCVKLGSDRGIMREVTMALLITCSFCPGEYVLFETAPRAPRDMRACVHRYACMRACECTRMLRTDHVFLLSRRLRSLRNRAAAARRRRNLPRPRSRRGCCPCRRCRAAAVAFRGRLPLPPLVGRLMPE